MPSLVGSEMCIRDSSSIIRYEYSLYVLQSRASRSRCSIPGISGRVDMLTSPVPAARAAVETGAWVESKHMYLIHGSKCGSSSFIITHPPEAEKRKKRKAYSTKVPGTTWCGTCEHPTDSVMLEKRGGRCRTDGPIRVLPCQMRHTIAAIKAAWCRSLS